MTDISDPPRLASENEVAALVDRFYGLARDDDRLGPMFVAAIADWDGHLAIVRDFWSRVLLGTQRYNGSPFAPHMRLPIELGDFDRWLSLFRRAAQETLPPAAAERAVAKADHMTESFRAGLFPWTLPDGKLSRRKP